MPPQWSEAADDWLHHTESDDATVVRKVLEPLMLQSLGAEGKKVLDIGCGEGYFARLTKAAGALETAGLDIAPALIEAAKERDKGGGEYYVHDIQTGPFFMGREFDAISASMMLMYMEDLDAAYKNIAAVLASGGKLVASIVNPYYAEPVGHWGWALPGRLHEGFDPRHRRWKLTARQVEAVVRGRFELMLYVRNYFQVRTVKKTLSNNTFAHVHRPFSDYINLARRHGLVLERLFEPQIPEELRAQFPSEPITKALDNVPLLFILDFTKDG